MADLSQMTDEELLAALQEGAGPSPLAKAGSATVQGANVGLANILGAPVDIVNLGLGKLGVPVSETPFLGSAFIREKLMEPTVQAAGAAARAGGLDVSPDVRATYRDLSEIEPQYRPFARAGEVVGSSLPVAVAPLAFAARQPMTALLNPAPTAGVPQQIVASAGRAPSAFLAKEAAITSGAAQGAALAEAAAPGSQTAALLGEMAGSVFAPSAVVTKGISAAAGGTEAALKRLTPAGRRDVAASRLGEELTKAGEDPEALRRALQKAMDSDVPVADVLDSPTLIGIQNRIAQVDPEFAQRIAERRAAGMQQVETGARAAIDPGSPEALRRAAKTQADEIAAGIGAARGEITTDLNKQLKAIDDYVTAAETRASEAAAKFRPAEGVRADANVRAREILEQAEENARAVERQLWDAVPNRKAVTQPNSFLAAYQNAQGRLLPTENLPAPIRGLNEQFAQKPPTVDDLLRTRSRLLSLARDARTGATPDRTAASIYDSLASAALDDVAGAVGDAGQQARAFSFALNDRFSRSFAGDVLGTSATGGARIAPELTLERAMGGGGAQGELRMRQLEQAAAPIDFATVVGTGRTRDLSPQMRIVQEQFLRANAEKLVNPATGQIAPARVESFLRENKDLMQRFPGLADDLRAAGRATEAIGARAGEARELTAKATELERTVTSLGQRRIEALNKVANVEDPVRLVDSALRGPTPSADIAALARVAQRGGPEAVAGLRGAMLDSVMGVEGAKDFEQIRKTLFEPISRDRPALAQIMRENGLLTATQQANLKRIIEKGAQLQRAAQSGRRIDDLTGPSDALFDFVLRSAGAKAGASGIAGQASGSSLVAASAGSKYFRKILDATPRTRTQEIFKEMLENPKLLDDMLFKAQSKKQQRQRFQSINAALVQAGITAPVDFSKEDEE